MKKSLIVFMCCFIFLLTACGKIENKDKDNESTIISLNSCFVVTGRGVVLTGKVESGNIRVGDNVIIKQEDQEIETKVLGLEKYKEIIEEAHTGDNIGIQIEYPNKIEIAIGDTMVVD